MICDQQSASNSIDAVLGAIIKTVLHSIQFLSKNSADGSSSATANNLLAEEPLDNLIAVFIMWFIAVFFIWFVVFFVLLFFFDILGKVLVKLRSRGSSLDSANHDQESDDEDYFTDLEQKAQSQEPSYYRSSGDEKLRCIVEE